MPVLLEQSFLGSFTPTLPPLVAARSLVFVVTGVVRLPILDTTVALRRGGWEKANKNAAKFTVPSDIRPFFLNKFSLDFLKL